ncbi:hypothetical protein [Candidatus Harpocratesius sp.]
MNYNSLDSGSLPEIHCPECHYRLDIQLIKLLLSGKTVYCEQCGFPFHGIESGDVKPLEKKQESPFIQKNLTKEEMQWIKWKKEWQRIKTQLKSNFSIVFSELFTNKGISKQESNYSSFNTNIQIDKKEKLKETREKEKYQKDLFRTKENTRKTNEKIKNLKSAKNVLVELTPFYYTLILIITLITSIHNRSWFHLVGLLLIEFYIITYDHREFLYSERRAHVSHAGIPMIILGFISIGINGIGILLLARGTLSVLIFIEETKQISQNHPVIHQNPQLNLIWNREIFYSFIPYIFSIFITFFIAGILGRLGKIFDNKNYSLGSFFYTLLSGGIIVLILYYSILPTLKYEKLEEIPLEKSIILIICGIFTLNLGVGIYLLIIGGLIITFQKELRKYDQKLPEVFEIRDLVDILVFPNQNETSENKISNVLDNLDQPVNYNNRKKVKRFDPQTGELLHPESIISNKNFPKEETTFNKKKIAAQKENLTPHNLLIRQENIRPVPPEGQISKIIFTVLDPEIRERLIKLPISNGEKDEISKAFLYLNKNAQKKYILELENVNKSEDLINTQYINRIRSLDMAREEQDFLINQLKYLPEEDLDEFVYILEKSNKN